MFGRKNNRKLDETNAKRTTAGASKWQSRRLSIGLTRTRTIEPPDILELNTQTKVQRFKKQ
jgi:hypothetical protein